MLKLPKRFHPDFSRPKVKPTGPVEIDWDNDLTRGLTFAYIPLLSSVFFGATNKSGSYVELVTQGTYALKEGTYIKAKGGQLSGSSATVMLETLQYGTAANRRLFSIAPFSPESSSNRDLAIVAHSNGGISAELAGVSTGVAGSWSYRNDGRVFVRYNGSNIDLEYTRTTGERHTATATNTASFVGYNGIFVNVSPYWGGNSNLPFKHVLVWDRALSDAEIKSLSDDPYQILKPANDLYYFTEVGGGGSTVEASALYSNINTMLSGKIGTLNASVDISSGYTDVDAGDVNYNVFSNFNTVTNYSSPSGLIVEVSTIFSTSSDMGNAPVSDVIGLVDFNTLLNSTSLANIIAQTSISPTTTNSMLAGRSSDVNSTAVGDVSSSVIASRSATISTTTDDILSSSAVYNNNCIANATLVNNIQSGFVVDRDCILNDSILFNVSSNYVSTTGDTGVSAIAAITSAYSMLAGNYAQTGAGISSVLSSIAQSVGISNQFAGIVDANNVSVLASGGQTNSSNCSFSLSSSDASISSISIEAIADYSTSLNLLCAVVSNMEASADYMSVASLISSNLSILNAQSSFGISSDLSVTRTMTTSAGATISVTCGYTTSGIQFTSTEVLTPDNRMIRVLSEGRIIQVLPQSRIIRVLA